MTKQHNVPLSEEEVVRLITGLDLIARSLGNGQQQNGLAAIAEVREKSAPVLALAEKLQGYLPKPEAPKQHDGPPANAKAISARDTRSKKLNGNGAHA